MRGSARDWTPVVDSGGAVSGGERAPGPSPASPRGADDALNMRFRGDPEAPSLARRALARHTPSDSVGLKVLVGRSAVLVEVTDSGPGFEHRPRRRGDAEESGWGLFLVERLAHRWGVGREGRATRVWFELLRG